MQGVLFLKLNISIVDKNIAISGIEPYITKFQAHFEQQFFYYAFMY